MGYKFILVSDEFEGEDALRYYGAQQGSAVQSQNVRLLPCLRSDVYNAISSGSIGMRTSHMRKLRLLTRIVPLLRVQAESQRSTLYETD